MRREGYQDNHKRLYRIYCEEGLNLRSKRPRRNHSASHRQPKAANSSSLHECWSMDFVSDQLYNGKRFRALTIMDNYSRTYLAIEAGKPLRGDDVANLMDRIKSSCGILPDRIKVDNGSEFISKVMGI